MSKLRVKCYIGDCQTVPSQSDLYKIIGGAHRIISKYMSICYNISKTESWFELLMT